MLEWFPMRTRDVAVLILHCKGKILLQKRPKDAERFPDSWGLFGGGLKKGETPEQALKREAVEELGLKIRSPKLTGSYPYVLPERNEKGNTFVFIERYDGSPLILREGQMMKWCLPSRALRTKAHPIYRKIIKKLCTAGLLLPGPKSYDCP